jgi:predicted alpha/beta-hydrolase family hydrolase
MAGTTVIELETSRGIARAHVQARRGARTALVLGHGAGGGVDAPDLLAACEVAHELHCTTVRIEQPYRVAGRRAPAPIAHCDEAWAEVIADLRRRRLRGMQLIVGGRSMGARVACRTAAEVDAIAVLCLAFPLQPPARSGKAPASSRLAELNSVELSALVVQGERDAFGMPPARRGARPRRVVRVTGDHSLTQDLDAVRAAVRAWLVSLPIND